MTQYLFAICHHIMFIAWIYISILYIYIKSYFLRNYFEEHLDGNPLYIDEPNGAHILKSALWLPTKIDWTQEVLHRINSSYTSNLYRSWAMNIFRFLNLFFLDCSTWSSLRIWSIWSTILSCTLNIRYNVVIGVPQWLNHCVISVIAL